MTGHEIAENLRNTKLNWGRKLLISDSPGDRYHCVLGIKALEHGATEAQLFKFYNRPGVFDPWEGVTYIAEVYQINDSCYSKEEVIEAFDDENNRDTDFPVERFVDLVKSL